MDKKINPIFPSSVKNIRPLYLKAGDEFKTTGLRVNSLSEIAHLPLVDNGIDLANSVKLIFGKNGYKKYFVQHYYPKRFEYRSSIGPKRHSGIINQVNGMDETIQSYLNNYDGTITFRLQTKKNTTYNLSSILHEIIPQSNDPFWDNSQVLDISHRLYLDIITGFIFNLELSDYLKLFKILDFQPISRSFKTVIVSIPVTSDRIDLSNRFLNPHTKIPRTLLRNREDMRFLSIMRFLIRYYGYDLENDSDFQHLKMLFDDFRLIFLFHNDKMGYCVDPHLARKQKMTYKMFHKQMEYCAKIILSANKNPEMFNSEIDELSAIVDNRSDSSNTERITQLISNSEMKKSVSTRNNSTRVKKKVGQDDDNSHSLFMMDQAPDEISSLIDDTDEEISESNDEDDLTQDDIEREILMQIDAETKPPMSPKQLKRLELSRNRYRSIETPEGRNLEEFLNDIETHTIDHEISNVKTRDSSVRSCSTIDFEKSYLKKSFEKDLLIMIRSFARNKTVHMHLIDYRRDDTSDQFNNRYTYTFNLEDDNFKKHRIKVNIPKMDENGLLFLNGNNRIMKFQQFFLPVIKVNPNRVIITSNYNKAFVERQGTILNRRTAVVNTLIDKYSSEFKNFKVSLGNNIKENSDFITTMEYDEMAKRFNSMRIGQTTFYFNQKKIRDIIKSKKIPFDDKPNILPIAIEKNIDVLTVEIKKTNSVSICDYIQSSMVEYAVHPDIKTMISSINTPKRLMFSTVMYQSKKIALIGFLGCLFGLTKILDTLDADVQFVDKKIPGDLRLFIKFKNGYLYYNEYPMEVSNLLNGLVDLHAEDYNLSEFNTILPYNDRFYDKFHSRHVLKGFTDAKDLFIDGITLQVLKDLKLPTNFLEVFLYANELLADNEHQEESYIGNYRFRKHEMIAAYLYEAMAKQYAIIRKKTQLKDTMSIPIDEVIRLINTSTIVENYDDISPINELKSKNNVTFKGPMGVKGDREVRLSKRGYDPSARGILGISSTDSQSVGVTKQISLDSRLLSNRGYIRPCLDDDEAATLSFAQVSSPEEAVLPYVGFHDDPKRTGFASVQTKHIFPVDGAEPGLVSSGFDRIMSDKVSDSYVKKAQKPGKITKIDHDGQFGIVQYNDGTEDRFEFGNVLSRNSSFFIEDHLQLNVREGDSVKKGSVLSYNKDFFKKDMSGELVYCQGTLARVAMLDSEATSEDSSLITERFSERTSSTTVARKQVALKKDANVISYLKIGDSIINGNPLMTFEDSENENEINAVLDILGDVDEEVLDDIARHRARSPKSGHIVDLKIYWTVPTLEMSESLRKIVDQYKTAVRKKINSEKSVTGKINPELQKTIDVSVANRDRINGAIVPEEGGVVFEYFIAHKKSSGVGDKLSFFSSLKSIIAQVIPKGLEPYTESGDRIDAMIGTIASNARMVTSMDIVGSLGKILDDYGRRIAKEFLDQ